MNLREAIEAFDKAKCRGSGDDPFSTILAAAKKQLAAEEAWKPPEIRLEAGYCRKCGLLTPTAHLEDLADWVCLKCRTEVSKPKRASLEEQMCATIHMAACSDPEDCAGKAHNYSHLRDAGDTLKALRETVVPFLKSGAVPYHTISRDGGDFERMLRALGEEP